VTHLLAADRLVAAGCTIKDQTGQVIGLCTGRASIKIPVSFPPIVPLVILLGGALVALLLAATLPKRDYPGLWAGITALAGVGTVVDGLVQWFSLSRSDLPWALGGQIFNDHLSAFFAILFGCATVLGALMSDGYLTREGLDGPEPYILLMMASAGAVLMAEAAGLISLFLGLEIMSIALYAMTAHHRRRAVSGEAALKYFVLGSFSSAVFIYGAALVYGATGATTFVNIFTSLVSNTLVHNGVLLAGMGLLIVGLGFKVAAVPFHFWAPDVYQGAPTPFTGYMAAVAKAGGFAGLVRILMLALPTQQADWRPVIWVLATASVLGGSVLALVQADLKRMLAYSSVSQAGYVLIGLQAGTSSGVGAVCFYLFTYTFMVIGTFAIVGVVQGRGEARNDLGSLRGLAGRNPWLAGAMLVLLLGQAGIPLTSGFLGKWVVISAVIAKGQYALGLIGMLGAAIAAFMYLRIAFVMYMTPATEAAGAQPGGDYDALATAGLAARETVLALRAPSTARLRLPAATAAVVVICVLVTIFAGVSTPVLSLSHGVVLPWSLATP
jgi:NADH-quinone oxidoreductase subunit N